MFLNSVRRCHHHHGLRRVTSGFRVISCRHCGHNCTTQVISSPFPPPVATMLRGPSSRLETPTEKVSQLEKKFVYMYVFWSSGIKIILILETSKPFCRKNSPAENQKLRNNNKKKQPSPSTTYDPFTLQFQLKSTSRHTFFYYHCFKTFTIREFFIYLLLF